MSRKKHKRPVKSPGKGRHAIPGVKPTTQKPEEQPIATPFGILATPFSAGGSGFAPPTDEELLDTDAPALFTGDVAQDSGLDISDEDLREDAQDEPAPETEGPLSAEEAARAWLQLKTKLKARRIAGLPDDPGIEAREEAAFERLKAALETDR